MTRARRLSACTVLLLAMQMTSRLNVRFSLVKEK